MQGGLPPFKHRRCALTEEHHPCSRSEKTSQESEANDFTSGMKWSDFTSKASRRLSEERLAPREDVKLSLKAQ